MEAGYASFPIHCGVSNARSKSVRTESDLQLREAGADMNEERNFRACSRDHYMGQDEPHTGWHGTYETESSPMHASGRGHAFPLLPSVDQSVAVPRLPDLLVRGCHGLGMGSRSGHEACVTGEVHKELAQQSGYDDNKMYNVASNRAFEREDSLRMEHYEDAARAHAFQARCNDRLLVPRLPDSLVRSLSSEAADHEDCSSAITSDDNCEVARSYRESKSDGTLDGKGDIPYDYMERDVRYDEHSGRLLHPCASDRVEDGESHSQDLGVSRAAWTEYSEDEPEHSLLEQSARGRREITESSSHAYTPSSPGSRDEEYISSQSERMKLVLTPPLKRRYFPGSKEGTTCFRCGRSRASEVYYAYRGEQRWCGGREHCMRWVCVGCDSKLPNGFTCCDCNPAEGVRRKKNRREYKPVPMTQRRELQRRNIKSNVFEFPGVPSRPHSMTYSVCTASNLCRVAVIDNNGTILCSRRECLRPPTVQAQASCAGRPCCAHGLALLKAQRDRDNEMGQASAFFSPSQVEIEVEAARKSGILKAKECDRILDLNASAVKEGVPLLVQIGTTGWFAIRESSFRRSVVGGWAHVKCDGLEGMGPQRIRRRGTMRPIMCKANNGHPCSESKNSTSRNCLHIGIVGLAVYNAPQVLEGGEKGSR